MATREDWVQPAPVAAAAGAAPATSGLLLQDRQIRITAVGDDRYEHGIEHVAADQASNGVARLTLFLDPRFQELVVHALRLLHADSSRTDLAAPQLNAQLHLQAAEAEPRKRVVDPRLLVRIEVPGAKAGDLLEWEYTVHSRASGQPGLVPGHYAAEWPCGTDQPVQLARLRVTWPPARPLHFRLSGDVPVPAPQIRNGAGVLELLWQNLRPPLAEEDTPRGFERQASVQLSDYPDWMRVATVMAPGYAAGAVPTAAAAGTILAIQQRVQARVQAIALSGTGLYAPAAPAVVWQRGYGEGRDIARLLVSLLRAAGFDAQVALADRHGGLAPAALPSPNLDAALVLVRADRQYWLDPMAAGPAPALQTWDPADLRRALLVAPVDGHVVTLPPAPADSRLRIVTEHFDLSAGNAAPASLTVATQFLGSWAAAARAQLRGQTPAQLQLTQIQAVAQDYPMAVAAGAVQVQDDLAGQRLQIAARFSLPPPLWQPDDPQFGFFAEALADAVQPRDEATRVLPLGLPYPLQMEEHIVAVLPAGFLAIPGEQVIENPAFRYQRTVRFAHGTLWIDHRYVARADHVDPADYPAFLAANAQVYQALGLRVRPQGRPTHWMAAALVVALLLVAIAGWRRLRRGA